MVDVKGHICFPTLIHEFKGYQTANSHVNMLNVIEFENKEACKKLRQQQQSN